MIKINSEEDIKKIKKIILDFGLGITLENSLKLVAKTKPGTSNENAKSTGYMRTFLMAFIKKLAKRISKRRKKVIPKKGNEIQDSDYRNYIKSIELINEKEWKLLNAFYGCYSNKGGNHQPITSIQQYRFIYVTMIECILLISSRLDKFLIKKGNPTPLPIVAITKEQFKELIDNTNGLHHLVAFSLLFHCGLAQEEISVLEKSDINLQERKIRIHGSKTFKERSISLNPDFKKSDLKYIPFKCGQRALQMAFNKYRDKLNLKNGKSKLKLSSLRKGFARELFINGYKHHKIQELLGHNEIGTTMKWMEEFRTEKRESPGLQIEL
jgi:hypothetical protein